MATVVLLLGMVEVSSVVEAVPVKTVELSVPYVYARGEVIMYGV
jgi:hypothetical protein